MSTMLQVYVVFSRCICLYGGFVVVAGADLWLRHSLPHMNRMRRGKYYRWSIRTLGPGGDAFWRIGWLMCIALPLILVIPEPFTTVGLVLYWVFLAVTLAVDWITGSDDPPYKRWVAEAAKKLKISAPPKPAIDLK